MFIVGLAAEGETDLRFLDDVLRRTIEEVVFSECRQDIDIYVHIVRADKGASFEDYVRNAIRSGVASYGVMALAMHADSDKDSYEERLYHKFSPVMKSLASSPEECNVLIPIIPVRMTEAWMLADKELLKEEIGTVFPDNELGLDKKPESVSDPKKLIEDDLRLISSGNPKKFRTIEISELYSALGSKVSLQKLRLLPSYCKFVDSIRDALRQYGFLS